MRQNKPIAPRDALIDCTCTCARPTYNQQTKEWIRAPQGLYQSQCSAIPIIDSNITVSVVRIISRVWTCRHCSAKHYTVILGRWAQTAEFCKICCGILNGDSWICRKAFTSNSRQELLKRIHTLSRLPHVQIGFKIESGLKVRAGFNRINTLDIYTSKATVPNCLWV